MYNVKRNSIFSLFSLFPFSSLLFPPRIGGYPNSCIFACPLTPGVLSTLLDAAVFSIE